MRKSVTFDQPVHAFQYKSELARHYGISRTSACNWQKVGALHVVTAHLAKGKGARKLKLFVVMRDLLPRIGRPPKPIEIVEVKGRKVKTKIL